MACHLANNNDIPLRSFLGFSISDLHCKRDVLYSIELNEQDAVLKEISKKLKEGYFSIVSSLCTQLLCSNHQYNQNSVLKLKLISENSFAFADVIQNIRSKLIIGQSGWALQQTTDLLKVVPESQEVKALKLEIETEMNPHAKTKQKQDNNNNASAEVAEERKKRVRTQEKKTGEQQRQIPQALLTEVYTGNRVYVTKIAENTKTQNPTGVRQVPQNAANNPQISMVINKTQKLTADQEKKHIQDFYESGQWTKASYAAADYLRSHPDDQDPLIIKIMHEIK